MSTSTPRVTVAERIRTVLLAVLSAFGVLVLLWLVASWIFGLHLVVLLTGSMSPTIPAGSVLVSHTVPASQLHRGDVVTLPHPRAGVPVTHRVVALEREGDHYSVTMQGDANSIVDSDPYPASEAPRVLFSVPHLGTALVHARDPVAMLGLAVLVAAVVAWGLWPDRAAAAATAPPNPITAAAEGAAGDTEEKA